MAPLATQANHGSVEDYLATITSPAKRQDAEQLIHMMQEVSGEAPRVWGKNAMIGFGSYTYTQKGRKEELEWFNLGFAARKTKLSIYLTCDIAQYQPLLDKLGKCKWGKGCLYVNKLADVDLGVLRQLMEASKDGP